MGGESLTITIDPDSELGRALEEINVESVVLVRGGARFRVIRESDALLANYDPQRVLRALRQSAGALAGVDVDALKRELREQRSQESLGRPA
jgi:hypothetical protein